MKDARYQEIADLMAEFNNLPDAAFVAVMADPRILEAVGLERVTTYREKRP